MYMLLACTWGATRTTSSGNGRPMAPESNSGHIGRFFEGISMFPCIGLTYASHMHPYGASTLIFKFYRRSSKSRHEAAIRIGATQLYRQNLHLYLGIPPLGRSIQSYFAWALWSISSSLTRSGAIAIATWTRWSSAGVQFGDPWEAVNRSPVIKV